VGKLSVNGKPDSTVIGLAFRCCCYQHYMHTLYTGKRVGADNESLTSIRNSLSKNEYNNYLRQQWSPFLTTSVQVVSMCITCPLHVSVLTDQHS
jgi:hypothetical protein